MNDNNLTGSIYQWIIHNDINLTNLGNKSFTIFNSSKKWNKSIVSYKTWTIKPGMCFEFTCNLTGAKNGNCYPEKNDGAYYRGNISVTENNYTCKNWIFGELAPAGATETSL